MLTVAPGCAEFRSGVQGFRVRTLEGDLFDASEHIGRNAMVITFWKATCDSCLRQMHVFAELRRMNASRGLVVLAVSIDGPQSRAQVRIRAADAGIDFPVLLDDDSTVFNRYDPHHDLPFTVIVNRDGSVRARYPGLYFTGLGARLLAEVEAALAEPPR